MHCIASHYPVVESSSFNNYSYTNSSLFFSLLISLQASHQQVTNYFVNKRDN